MPIERHEKWEKLQLRNLGGRECPRGGKSKSSGSKRLGEKLQPLLESSFVGNLTTSTLWEGEEVLLITISRQLTLKIS